MILSLKWIWLIACVLSSKFFSDCVFQRKWGRDNSWEDTLFFLLKYRKRWNVCIYFTEHFLYFDLFLLFPHLWSVWYINCMLHLDKIILTLLIVAVYVGNGLLDYLRNKVLKNMFQGSNGHIFFTNR